MRSVRSARAATEDGIGERHVEELPIRRRDEVMGAAERSLQAALEAIPNWFGRLPVTPCEVVRMLPHEEAHSTIAYYREQVTLTLHSAQR